MSDDDFFPADDDHPNAHQDARDAARGRGRVEEVFAESGRFTGYRVVPRDPGGEVLEEGAEAPKAPAKAPAKKAPAKAAAKKPAK